MSDVFDVQSCIVRVRAGEERASVALVEHLHPLVRKLVRNHLPRREAEEDLMQQAMIKVFQKLDVYQVREGFPFEHWVARLTVRTCLDALRAERSRPEWRMADLGERETEWLDFLVTGQTEPMQPASATDAKAVVTRLLAQLSPPDRLVLTLLDLEQRSTLEISQITGWTRPMVKMRAMRARLKLRQAARRVMKSEFTDHE
ncbi:MAG: polymerase subunit sigma-24 [Verrucomicrobiaceae bacterium]|nr:polymerase subunit sigma-24 [Verrucomicrobiaceae bacterium]